MMRAITLVLTSALVAGGFVALDGNSSGMTDPGSLAGTAVNRAAKSDRLVKAASNDRAAENIRIEVDHGRGLTTVIRRSVTPAAATGETDFAFLAN